MSLYKRGEWWQSRVVIDGRKYQNALRVTSKTEARKLEAAIRTQIMEGRFGLGKAPTIREFSDQFLNYVSSRRPKSLEVYKQGWAHVLKFEPLAKARLSDVKLILEDFIQHLLGQGMAVATVNNVLRCLRRALFIARELEKISKVPKLSLLPNEHQRDFVIDEATEARLTEASDGVMKFIIPFAIDTGLRAGEICRLTWADVETGSGPVAVRVREGKSKYAPRRVALTKRCSAILEHLRQQAHSQYVFETQYTTREGWHPLSVEYMSGRFKRTRRALGISEECCFHSMRHTFCTRVGASGASAFEIQKLAGHSSINVSARYTHPENQQLDAAIARMGR